MLLSKLLRATKTSGLQHGAQKNRTFRPAKIRATSLPVHGRTIHGLQNRMRRTPPGLLSLRRSQQKPAEGRKEGRRRPLEPSARARLTEEQGTCSSTRVRGNFQRLRFFSISACAPGFRSGFPGLKSNSRGRRARLALPEGAGGAGNRCAFPAAQFDQAVRKALPAVSLAAPPLRILPPPPGAAAALTPSEKGEKARPASSGERLRLGWGHACFF